MLVLKFGGTSVADAQPIARAAAIVSRARGPRVVVVSALAGVTDRLLQMADFAATGKVDAALAVLDRLAARHRDVMAELLAEPDPDVRDDIDRTCRELEALVRAAAVLRDVSSRTRDAIAAAGELMSSRIIAASFGSLGVPATWVDARAVFVTDDHHGDAAPNMTETAARVALHLKPLLEEGRVPVVGGFVGATAGAVTTTFGRGGSDFSAAILGACLGAREIQIWTDVDGVLAADPRLVRDPHQVPQLTFAEARELAYFGAKVLHPSTIEPAIERGIPVRILNSRRPEGAGTVVNGATSRRLDRPAALACKRAVAVVEARPRGAQRPAAFVRRVFEAFEHARLHPCVTTVSDAVVVAAFDDEPRARLAAMALADAAHVTVRRDLALLSAVGEGLSTAPRLAAGLLAALDGLTVHAVAQPPSGRSITMLVDDADVGDAMQRVYEQFVMQPAARTVTDSAVALGAPGALAAAGVQPS
jgi:aspartate kinase